MISDEVYAHVRKSCLNSDIFMLADDFCNFHYDYLLQMFPNIADNTLRSNKNVFRTVKTINSDIITYFIGFRSKMYATKRKQQEESYIFIIRSHGDQAVKTFMFDFQLKQASS